MEYIYDIILYLLVFLASSILMYYGLSISKKSKFGFLLIVASILIPSIMAGIRYDVGVDYFPYLGMYENAVNGSPIYYRSIEPLSTGIIVLSSYLHSSFFMFFLFSLITNSCFYLAFQRIFKKNSGQTSVAFFLYLCILFSTSLNAVRSGVAISVVALAFSYLIQEWSKKAVTKSLLLVIVACLFHSSAFLAFVFYPVFWMSSASFKHNQSFKKGLLFIAYVIVAILTPQIVSLFGDSLLFDEYGKYLLNVGSSFSIPLADILMSIFAIWSFIVLRRKISDEWMVRLSYCMIFYIPLSIVVGWLTVSAGLSRITFMLEFLVICGMAYHIIHSKKNSLPGLITILLVIAITGSMFMRNLNWSGALPYKTIFQNEVSYASEN